MKKTEEEKLLEVLEKAEWCSHTDKAKKTIHVFSDITSMKFANYSKELKKLTKKMEYQIQLVIK